MRPKPWQPLDGGRFVTTVEGDFVAATPERHCGLYVYISNPNLFFSLQEFGSHASSSNQGVPILGGCRLLLDLGVSFARQ